MKKRKGKLKDLVKFDDKLFGVNEKKENVMEKKISIMIEIKNEDIIDEGVKK